MRSEIVRATLEARASEPLAMSAIVEELDRLLDEIGREFFVTAQYVELSDNVGYEIRLSLKGYELWSGLRKLFKSVHREQRITELEAATALCAEVNTKRQELTSDDTQEAL